MAGAAGTAMAAATTAAAALRMMIVRMGAPLFKPV
jgi:hypothetical protein